MMKLCELLRGVNVKKCALPLDTEISQICSDSREVLPGGMFICVTGTHRDGHDYISDAVSRSCAVVVLEREVADDVLHVPYVLVENTRLAEAYIWNNFYARPADGMRVIAVTGTNGKTSCAFMMREIFRRAGAKVGLITTVRAMFEDEVLGTLGGSSVSDVTGAMTTPDPEYLYGTIAMMKNRAADVLVLEVSSHALSQYKTDPLSIDIAVFTNLSEEHLDYHGTMENYFAAKCRLAESAARLIINDDDVFMHRLKDMFARDKRVVTCSADSTSRRHLSADVSALRQSVSLSDGAEYVYFSKEAVFRLSCPIPGGYTVQNSLLAAAAALECSVSAESVRDALGKITSIDGRLERVDLSEYSVGFSAYVDYAHTPAALEALLLFFRRERTRGQRIILLFGCGGERDRSKRRRMGDIASRLADFVIVTSDNSRNEDAETIISEIVSGLDLEKPHAVIKDRREAIEYGVSCAREGDILLLAGKGHEKYEIDASGKHPFDEAAILRAACDMKNKNNDKGRDK